MYNYKDVAKNKYLSTIPEFASKDNRRVFGIILTLCALSFFGFFVIKPTASSIFRLNKEIEDNKFILNQQETKIRNLTALRMQYANLQDDLPRIMNTITAQPDVPLLFGQIQAVGKMSNVTLKKLQNSEVQIINNNRAEKDYYSYSFSVTGTGSSEDINNFTQALTDMERIININTFSLNNVADKRGQSGLEFNIQGIAFFKGNS